MFDARKLLEQFLGSQIPGVGGTVRGRADQAVQYGKDNPMKASALAAAVLGTKTGRNIAGNALTIGGLAAIAGLGYQAYKNYRDGAAPQPQSASVDPQRVEILPPPSDSGFSTEPAVMRNDFVLVLVQAMIAAAKADGHIDADERAHIMDKVKLSGFESEAEAFFEKELAAPTDLDALVSAARTEEQKVELYTASRLAIEPDSRTERGYLDMLAGRLGLPDALIDHIEATVSGVKV